MHFRVFAALLAIVCMAGAPTTGMAPAPQPVEFRAHVIESKMPGGYAVLATDFNKDGKLDVMGVSQRVPELAWYENPTWERHVIAEGMTQTVNLAAADLDGDGIPELALETGFAMVPANSEGLVWILRHQGDPKQPSSFVPVEPKR